MVANCLASCGTHISPIRTATRSWIWSTVGAMAPAKATVSIPSEYPLGSKMLSNPSRSAVCTMSRQCDQLLDSRGSGTPKNS